MSLSSFGTFFPIGQEPYTKPVTTQPQIFQYPVTCTSTLDVINTLTCEGPLDVLGNADFKNNLTCEGQLGVLGEADFKNNLTCERRLFMSNGESIILSETLSTGSQSNYINTRPGGCLVIEATARCSAPVYPEDVANGLEIGWDIDGRGESDLISMGSGTGVGGFSFKRLTNSSLTCVNMMTIEPLAQGGITVNQDVASLTMMNPDGTSYLLLVQPNKLPVFTYGPVCYGYVPASFSATWSASSLVAPYFITGGFQIINNGTGNYQVGFPKNLSNVTGQVTLVGPGGNIMGAAVSSQNNTQLLIETYCMKDSNIATTVLESLSFNFVIYAGALTV